VFMCLPIRMSAILIRVFFLLHGLPLCLIR